MTLRAKKSLGQHFLRSKTALTQIIESAKLSADDVVLEIGPGEGALTEGLLATGARVVAVETDERCIGLLEERFASFIKTKKFTLLHGDIRNEEVQKKLFTKAYLGVSVHGENFGCNAQSFSEECREGRMNNTASRPRRKTTSSAPKLPHAYKLVANIPYYITGMLFRLFLETLRQPSTIVFLIQKEVAEQIVARDGKEGILSLAVKIFGAPRYVAKVKREAFSPPPKVDSAIIAIENISLARLDGLLPETYFRVVKAGLAARRKMLLGNLRELGIAKEILEAIFNEQKIPLTARGEDVPATKWRELAKALAPHLK